MHYLQPPDSIERNGHFTLQNIGVAILLYPFLLCFFGIWKEMFWSQTNVLKHRSHTAIDQPPFFSSRFFFKIVVFFFQLSLVALSYLHKGRNFVNRWQTCSYNIKLTYTFKLPDIIFCWTGSVTPSVRPRRVNSRCSGGETIEGWEVSKRGKMENKEINNMLLKQLYIYMIPSFKIISWFYNHVILFTNFTFTHQSQSSPVLES